MKTLNTIKKLNTVSTLIDNTLTMSILNVVDSSIVTIDNIINSIITIDLPLSSTNSTETNYVDYKWTRGEIGVCGMFNSQNFRAEAHLQAPKKGS